MTNDHLPPLVAGPRPRILEVRELSVTIGEASYPGNLMLVNEVAKTIRHELIEIVDRATKEGRLAKVKISLTTNMGADDGH